MIDTSSTPFSQIVENRVGRQVNEVASVEKWNDFDARRKNMLISAP